jgi:hypothetical protein
MKYYKIKEILFVLIAVFFVSCQDDDDNTTFDPIVTSGTDLTLTTLSLTNLDEDHSMRIRVETDEINTVEKIEIFPEDGDTASGQATITEGEAIFSSSLLGSLKDKSATYIRTLATLKDGTTVEKQQSTIAIDKSIYLTTEISAIKYEDSNDTANDTLIFETATESAVIDAISLEWKKGMNGTYVAANPLGRAFDITGDTIPFVNLDINTYTYGLQIKDTLYLKFAATSGSIEDVIETSIPVIANQTLATTSSAIIYSDLTQNKLNLETAEVYADDDAEGMGEIKYKSPLGIEIEGTTALEFVKITDLSSEREYLDSTEEFFAEKDLLKIKEYFDAGTAVTEITTAAKDDLYVYKVTRTVEAEDIVKYGILLVGDISTTTVNGEMTSEINIEYGEQIVE